MDTIATAAFEVIFYLIDRLTSKPVEEEEKKKVQLVLPLFEKSGVLLVPRKNKPPMYVIKVPDKDIFLENLFFESTSDIGVSSEVRVAGRKERERILYIEPTEFYSKEFYSQLLKLLMGKRGGNQ